MTSVRFLYTSQPGKGFTELTSPQQQLKNWLRDNLRQPNSGNIRYFDKGLGVTLQDGLVICTYLSRQFDDNRRPFARNHSALLTEVDYSQMAKDFGNSILAQIEEQDEDIVEAGGLKPLHISSRTANGLSEKELTPLASHFAKNLQNLLASLIAGKAFSIQVKGTQDEAMALAITLLKIAALGDLPIPQISTFEPNGKTRTWYPSQVLPTPHARLAIQFQPKEAPGREATEKARRLARAVENLDPDGIAHAMVIGRDQTAVRANQTAQPAAPAPAGEERTEKPATAAATRERDNLAEVRSRNNDRQLYQYNKEYEADLIRQQREVEALREKLDEQQRQILAQEKDLKQREKDVSEAEAHVKRKGARRDQWRHIEEIFGVLDNHQYQKLEGRVLSRFFDDLKNLEPDNLQALKDGVKDFLPGLEKIAKLNEPQKDTFLKDLEAIKKKLEGKSSRRLFG